MYDNNITAQEISDYIADMLEMGGEFLAPPTEEEMEAMYNRFCVESGLGYKEFATYREAEIYCGEHDIHPENIFEF